MSNPKLTKIIIDAAILGFEEQKARIDAQIAELRAIGSDEPGEAINEIALQPKRARRKISAAGRRAMAAAQRKRWAGVKGETETKTAGPVKPKRKLSAAGKAAIVPALKKRWTAKKAAKKK